MVRAPAAFCLVTSQANTSTTAWAIAPYRRQVEPNSDSAAFEESAVDAARASRDNTTRIEIGAGREPRLRAEPAASQAVSSAAAVPSSSTISFGVTSK